MYQILDINGFMYQNIKNLSTAGGRKTVDIIFSFIYRAINIHSVIKAQYFGKPPTPPYKLLRNIFIYNR